MAKKINWAGIIIVVVCILGIWYVSSGYEETVSASGTLRVADDGTIWIEGDSGIWYMPDSPLSDEFLDGMTVSFTGIQKHRDIARSRAKYISVEILEIAQR